MDQTKDVALLHSHQHEELWDDDEGWDTAARLATPQGGKTRYGFIKPQDDKTIPRKWKGYSPFNKVKAPKLGRSYTVDMIDASDEASGYGAIALQLSRGTLEYCLLRENKGDRMETASWKFCQEVGIDSRRAMGKAEMEKIQSFIKPRYQLICVDAQDIHRVVFIGAPATEQLLIERDGSHYNAIHGTLRCYMQCYYFCIPCWRRADYRTPHRCYGGCDRCYDEDVCVPAENRVECYDCNRIFYSLSCYENHHGNVCNEVRRCRGCSKDYLRKDHHLNCPKVLRIYFG